MFSNAMDSWEFFVFCQERTSGEIFDALTDNVYDLQCGNEYTNKEARYAAGAVDPDLLEGSMNLFLWKINLWD